MSSTLTPPPTAGARVLGDPELWVERYGDSLLRFALSRVPDQQAAEDLVQETLLSAWRGRDAFDGGCAPLTWLTAILRRRLADHFRRAGRRSREVPDNSACDDSACHRTPRGTPAEADEFWSVLSACEGQMPGHLVRAFRLRTFAEVEPAAICESEGISRKNLSVRLHRARTMLRRCLERKWFTGSPRGSDA